MDDRAKVEILYIDPVSRAHDPSMRDDMSMKSDVCVCVCVCVVCNMDIWVNLVSFTATIAGFHLQILQ